MFILVMFLTLALCFSSRIPLKEKDMRYEIKADVVRLLFCYLLVRLCFRFTVASYLYLRLNVTKFKICHLTFLHLLFVLYNT